MSKCPNDATLSTSPERSSGDLRRNEEPRSLVDLEAVELRSAVPGDDPGEVPPTEHTHLRRLHELGTARFQGPLKLSMSPDELLTLTPRAFEIAIAEMLRSSGFRDVVVVGGVWCGRSCG
jgi:hypothetical protein